MRIAVVSDVHGHLVALEAVIEDLARQAPDVTVQGGDLAVIGPRPAEVVDLVRELGWPGVVGNTDEMLWDPGAREVQMRRAPGIRDWLEALFDTLAPWALDRLGPERLAWLRRLPQEWRHLDLLLTHASPGDLWQAPMPDATDEELAGTYTGHQAGRVVYGHIHRPFVRPRPGLTVANSGSVGLPYDGDWRPSYLLIDDGVPSVHRVEYDVERGIRDMVDSGFPMAGWLAGNQRRGRFSRP
jgi:predicted phosphodiesterase